MTNEEKLNALLDSTNIAWDYAFDGWDWFEMSPNRFHLTKTRHHCFRVKKK